MPFSFTQNVHIERAQIAAKARRAGRPRALLPGVAGPISAAPKRRQAGPQRFGPDRSGHGPSGILQSIQ